MNEAQRAQLRRIVADVTEGGKDMGSLPKHKTGLANRLREQGRHEEAVSIENGAGFSLSASDNGVVWIISGGRRERLFDEVERGQ